MGGGASPDEEEAPADAVLGEDVEDARGRLGIGSVVEGERRARRAAGTPPMATEGQEMRAPGVTGPRDGGGGKPGGIQEARSFASVAEDSTRSTMVREACGRR
jgi:hypothetical protein